ncbi:hypothetical protein [Tomitella fengzijianii]|nr:hypothetical protein [Tomitella fengzijianii]
MGSMGQLLTPILPAIVKFMGLADGSLTAITGSIQGDPAGGK